MAYKIERWCTSCDLCPTQCPEGAIAVGFPYTIDAEKCNDCGICAKICPAGAPVKEDEKAENQNMF